MRFVTSPSNELHSPLLLRVPQVDAVRTGMTRVVPMPLLMAFNGAQLEALVVGKPELDLHFLVSAWSTRGGDRGAAPQHCCR